MKRHLSPWTVILMLVSLCACLFLTNPEPALEYAQPYIGFARAESEDFSLEDYTRTPVEQIDTHEPVWGEYAADVYYSRLDVVAQRIYRILCYGMDTERPYILIDDRLLEGTDFSLQDILYAMALDSPMVEQNLEWEYGDFSSTVTHPRLFLPAVVETLSGQSLYVGEFAPEKLEKKRKALEKAQEIAEKLPDDLTPCQTAQEIYTYLGRNVQYFNTETDREALDYLYDALCTGRSNCDGFANAFSLLCSLSGIRSCEKMSDLPEGEEGHTWNAVELDGIWYNVDATASDQIKNEPTLFLHFGFPDTRQEPLVWGSSLCPPCPEELFPYDCVLTSESGAGRTVENTFKKTDRDYLIVYAETGELSEEALQDIADTTFRNITTYSTEVLTGGAVHYIYFD